jgi:hypothetical protein
LKRARRLLAGLVAASALAAGGALARPGYYVVTVYDDPGLRTLDFRYWTVKPPNYPTIAWPEVGFGWNVNGRWYTEAIASWIGSANFATRLETLNWQNDVLLTQGQYPVDVALHTLLVRPQHPAAGYELEFGPALQTDIERTQVNLNLVFVRHFDEPGSPPTEFNYQWQLRYRWTRWLHVGAQGFGELGPWDHWLAHDAQSHRAGPALFGVVPMGPDKVGWQAAYLVGKTNARRANMLSTRLKYDF